MPNSEVVQRQLEAFNNHDIDAFLGCYAEDAMIRQGDGQVTMTGHEAIRGFYGPVFQEHPELVAEVLNRLEVGEWVVDEEHTSISGFDVHALIAYNVQRGRIQNVVMMTPG